MITNGIDKYKKKIKNTSSNDINVFGTLFVAGKDRLRYVQNITVSGRLG